MTNAAVGTSSPWLTMWTQPRATIQHILDTNPTRHVILLTALSGIARSLDRASSQSSADTIPLPILVIIILCIGPIVAIAGLYAASWLVLWTGSWLGGVAKPLQLRAAMAWASLPAVWGLLLWIPYTFLFGIEMFQSETPRIDAQPYNLMALALVEVVLLVWWVVLNCKAVAQAQGFSAWKGLLNLLLAAAVVIVPIVLIALAIT